MRMPIVYIERIVYVLDKMKDAEIEYYILKIKIKEER